MYTMFLHKHAHISTKFGQLREIKESVESEEHAGPVRANSSTQARKLACMHTICLSAQINILVKSGQIREIKVSRVSEEHTGHI